MIDVASDATPGRAGLAPRVVRDLLESRGITLMTAECRLPSERLGVGRPGIGTWLVSPALEEQWLVTTCNENRRWYGRTGSDAGPDGELRWLVVAVILLVMVMAGEAAAGVHVLQLRLRAH